MFCEGEGTPAARFRSASASYFTGVVTHAAYYQQRRAHGSFFSSELYKTQTIHFTAACRGTSWLKPPEMVTPILRASPRVQQGAASAFTQQGSKYRIADLSFTHQNTLKVEHESRN